MTCYTIQTLNAASVSSINTTFNAQSSLTLGGGAKTAANIRLVAWPRVWGRALPTRLKAEKWSTRTETELESTWHWSPRESRPCNATFFHSDGWPVGQRNKQQIRIQKFYFLVTFSWFIETRGNWLDLVYLCHERHKTKGIHMHRYSNFYSKQMVNS